MNWADRHGYNFLSQYATREENDMKIKTEFVNPPIPIRDQDWSAIDDDTYDGPGSYIGRGATEAEAVQDLLEKKGLNMDMTNEQPQPDVLMVWAENLVQAKVLKSMAEDALTKANEQIAGAEEKLSEIMAERDMQSFKTTDGRLFYKYVSSFPKVKNEAGFYEWLEAHGEAGIIKRTIHPQTLRAWYKDKSLEHGDELADKLEVFEKIRIGVRT